MVSETQQSCKNCDELLTRHIIITNTQKFLHFTEEATITISASMMSVKQMRLHKTHELVMSQKNTSKQQHYGIQLSAPNSIVRSSMGKQTNQQTTTKKPTLFAKHNNSFIT